MFLYNEKFSFWRTGLREGLVRVTLAGREVGYAFYDSTTYDEMCQIQGVSITIFYEKKHELGYHGRDDKINNLSFSFTTRCFIEHFLYSFIFGWRWGGVKFS